MIIPMKTVNGTCKCGTAFSQLVPAGINDPTMCEVCVIEYQRKMEENRRQHNIRDFATGCGINEKYRLWDSDLAARIGSDRMLDWLRGINKQGAWLGGTNGIGKTHVVSYRAYEMLQTESLLSYVVRASSWLRDIVILRTGKSAADGERMYKRACSCALFVLDDLGKENLTRPRAELLFDIIDERDRADLPLWVTANIGGTALLARLNAAGEHEIGKAIMKRLKRMIPRTNIWKDNTQPEIN